MRCVLKNYKILLSIFVVYILINMIILPSLYIGQTLAGLNAWAMNVLPSVLPFMFFTKILSELGTVEKFSGVFARPMQKFFKAPAISSYVFLMSIVSGYPVGAKMTADLYQSGKISRSEALRMCSFCSTSGPMFIIGAVGAGMLGNSKLGYIIFLSHILGAFLNGFLYRNIKAKDTEISPANNITKNKTDINTIVVDSALSIISVGVIIAIFFCVITSLSPLFNLFPPQVSGLLSGVVEITKGCTDIASTLPANFAVMSATFIISFGGISTLLQSLTMLSKLNMPVGLFALQKFSHALLATIISVLLLFLSGLF